jgi:putative DNA primase/helicase
VCCIESRTHEGKRRRPLHELTEAFFHSLFAPALREPELLEAAQVTLWTLPDRVSRHLPLADLTNVAKTALDLDAQGKDVYFGVALRCPGLTARERGGKGDLGAVTALWLDIDIQDASSVHAARNLPTSEEEAMEIVSAVGIPPSAVVHSGHGLHVYWFIDQPFPLLDAKEVAEFEHAVAALQHRAKEYAARRGWHLDLLTSADRVLRVPGTTNHKTNLA